MRKSGNRLLPLGLVATLLFQTVPANAAYAGVEQNQSMGYEEKREESIKKGVSEATLADWKLGETYAKVGTSIEDGTLIMEDQSGKGNDLELQFYEGKKVTQEVPSNEILEKSLSFSEETMNSSADGSMVFDGDNVSGTGVDLVTVEDAPINKETFMDGYTLEFLYKLPADWTQSVLHGMWKRKEAMDIRNWTSFCREIFKRYVSPIKR